MKEQIKNPFKELEEILKEPYKYQNLMLPLNAGTFEGNRQCEALLTIETKKTKEEIDNVVFGIGSEKRTKVYINKINAKLNFILYQVDLRLKLFKSVQDEGTLGQFYTNLMLVLMFLSLELQKEYSIYIDKPQQKTVDDFDLALYHEFLKEYQIIKKNAQNSIQSKESSERLEIFILKSLSDFKDKYQSFAVLWINQEKELGYSVGEKDYLNYLLNKKRFEVSKNESEVTPVIKHCSKCNKTFKFDKDFYKNYIERYYSLQNQFIQSKLEQVKIFLPKDEGIKSETSTLLYALFHCYKQEGKYEPSFEKNSTTTKREAIKQQGKKYGVGEESFANSYYKISIKNRRINKSNIIHIKKAIELLAAYPKGKEIAEAELKEAELLQ